MAHLRPVSRVWLVALVFVGLSLWLVRPSGAQTADMYTITNVTVDVTADNVALARTRAMAEGQRKAFEALIQRITAPADWSRVPKPSDADIENMVLDVGIDQEKRSSVRYIVTMSVRFRPENVRRTLRAAGIAFAEWRGRPVVVLPVYQQNDGPVLVDGPNPWRDAWRSPSAQGVVPLYVPNPDQIDGVVSAAQAAAGGDEVVNAVAQRFNTQDVVIAVATPILLEGGATKLDVAYLGSGPVGSLLQGSRSYTGEAGQNVAAVLAKAVEDAARTVNDGWKGGNLLQFDTSGSLSVLVPISGLPEWTAIRAKLARSTPVRSYEVAAISKTEAAVVLHYVGEQKQLESVFMQNGLVLSWAEDHWVLQSVSPRPASGSR